MTNRASRGAPSPIRRSSADTATQQPLLPRNAPAPLVVSCAAEKVALQLDISEPSKCLLSQPPPPGEKGITPESPLSQSSGCLSFDGRRIWPNRGEVSLVDVEPLKFIFCSLCELSAAGRCEGSRRIKFYKTSMLKQRAVYGGQLGQ